MSSSNVAANAKAGTKKETGLKLSSKKVCTYF